jgi:hypothetical protein
MKRNGFSPKLWGFYVTSAACPSGAIAMHHFIDGQILAQVEALFSQVDLKWFNKCLVV